MSLGDSKTLAGSWQPILAANLTVASGEVWGYSNGGVGGDTVAAAAAGITARLAAFDATSPTSVLCNWGANDVGSLPAEATWKANYLTIIDAISAKWTGAKVYLSRPWRRGYTLQSNTLAGWIGDIVAARPGVAYVADDERVWLENGDDGAVLTTDGIHYSAAGQAAKAAQMLTVLGY